MTNIVKATGKKVWKTAQLWIGFMEDQNGSAAVSIRVFDTYAAVLVRTCTSVIIDTDEAVQIGRRNGQSVLFFKPVLVHFVRTAAIKEHVRSKMDVRMFDRQVYRWLVEFPPVVYHHVISILDVGIELTVIGLIVCIATFSG